MNSGPFIVSRYGENVRRYAHTCNIHRVVGFAGLLGHLRLVGPEARIRLLICGGLGYLHIRVGRWDMSLRPSDP